MLNLQLLGERRLWRDGSDISARIRYRKGWALLGYLAVERGQQHSREQIAQLLWPTLAPAAARTNLRQVVSDLGQALGSPQGNPLGTTRDCLSLPLRAGHGFGMDLFLLEEAASLGQEPNEAAILAVEQVIGQLGGPFLAGLSLPDCVDYEHWLASTRQRLAALTEQALVHLCGTQQAIGRLQQAITSASRLVVLDGWNEPHRRRLMLLLAESGMHAQALEQYAQLEIELRNDLGTVPAAQTQALRARIEADGRRQRVAVDGVAPPPRLQAGGREEGAPDTLLIGDTTTAVRGWLRVEKGSEPGRQITISREPVVIGRARDSGLCMVHDTVSRQHCMVWQDDAGFRICDLGSTNGTQVNGAMVQEAALGDGDRIILGETVLSFGCDFAPCD